jgi:hypothetical protein
MRVEMLTALEMACADAADKPKITTAATERPA